MAQSKPTGDGLFLYSYSKVGTPYYYGSKMKPLTETFMAYMHKQYPGTVTNAYNLLARTMGLVGRTCVDCSGLVQIFTGKVLGSAQLYSNAYTRLKPTTYKDWANGVVVWRKGHVGVFGWLDNQPVVVEAKGIRYGTVITPFRPKEWTYGLTFAWLDYIYLKAVAQKEWKKPNPYTEPTLSLCTDKTAKKKGIKQYVSSGNDVKWLQYELQESGYSDVDIDGHFGPITDRALRDFQKSSKLTVDGICGKITRRSLKAV